MSRIILSRHTDNSLHVVVGWDNMLQSFFWQEYQMAVEDGEVDWEGNSMLPGDRFPAIGIFMNSIPESVVDLMNETLMGVLDRTRDIDPSWTVDLSEEYGWRPMVKVVGEANWYGNGMIFATAQEALSSSLALCDRWLNATAGCAMPINGTVNYKIENNKEVRI